MTEYCIFQKDFDPFLYLQKPLDLNKDFKFNSKRFIEHGAQIPTIFSEKYYLEFSIHSGFLNIIKQKFNIDIILENDYLQLFIFISKFSKIKYYRILVKSKEKISNYFVDNSKSEDLDEYANYCASHDNIFALKKLIKRGINLSYDELLDEACDYDSNFKVFKFLLENGATSQKFTNLEKSFFNNNSRLINYIKKCKEENDIESLNFYLKRYPNLITPQNLDNFSFKLADKIYSEEFSTFLKDKIEMIISNQGFNNKHFLRDLELINSIIENCYKNFTDSAINSENISIVAEYVEKILELGFKINLNKAFIMSCMFKDEKLAKLCLDSGVDVDIDNGMGLYISQWKGMSESFIKLLLSYNPRIKKIIDFSIGHTDCDIFLISDYFKSLKRQNIPYLIVEN